MPPTGLVVVHSWPVCLFFCYQTDEHDILKVDEPILMPFSTSGPQGKSIKLSTLGVRRSKVKVTWCQSKSQKFLLKI